MSHVDKNDTFYQRIRAGNKSAVDEMILGNLPLVKSRVGDFLKEYRRFKRLKDDLYGEGILALTQAVNSFANREVEKPTGCIVSAIDYALKNYVDSECGHGLMSRRTVQRRRASDDSLPQHLPFDVAEPPAKLWRNASGRMGPKQIDSDGEYDSFGRPSNVSHSDAEQISDRYAQETASTDVLDQILACCESEQEQEIIRLRIDGNTDEEIGEQLGISRQTVGRRRERIEERFERMK